MKLSDIIELEHKSFYYGMGRSTKKWVARIGAWEVTDEDKDAAVQKLKAAIEDYSKKDLHRRYYLNKDSIMCLYPSFGVNHWCYDTVYFEHMVKDDTLKSQSFGSCLFNAPSFSEAVKNVDRAWKQRQT